MMEKRKHPRYPVDPSIQVINLLDDQPMGTLVNLSLGGFMALCDEQSPAPEAVVQLRLHDSHNRLPDIRPGAVCIWREKTNAGDAHWCGFRFIDLSDEDRAHLAAYLERLSAP